VKHISISLEVKVVVKATDDASLQDVESALVWGMSGTENIRNGSIESCEVQQYHMLESEAP
jgi:hypothetical protein